jgi:excisionase family DNA binding protein
MTNTDEITTFEAAERLGVSMRTVVRYISRGSLAARQLYRQGPYMVKVADLEKITPGRSPRDPLLTDGFLRQIGKEYVAAELAGESPRRVIAAKHDRSLGTADRWIIAAKKHGFINGVD